MPDISSEMSDSDYIMDQLISEYDDTVMPLPDIESEPHLLISKVRKHYMKYIIKLLSVNYESNQKLLNKNIYLPSAIWRCAKTMETKAAQTCMVVQLYRKNIVSMIKDIKDDTKKGRLNKKLYDCLHRAPTNEKKSQTPFAKSPDCTCLCSCNQRKKRRKEPESHSQNHPVPLEPLKINQDWSNMNGENKIPVIVNSQMQFPQRDTNTCTIEQTVEMPPMSEIVNQSNISPSVRMSIETQDSDELMMQLEKLFQGDPDDDDLFSGTLCDTLNSATYDINKKPPNENSESCEGQTQLISTQKQDNVIENHAAQIKSLDERLASLTGLLVNKTDDNVKELKEQKPEQQRTKSVGSSKWLCEEYFLKSRLFELLDQIGDTNRKKLAQIKKMLLELFGDDSDDEGVVSPLEETPEFVVSCKERIAPSVVKILTPYYIKGRIKGKALFKALAKHLIRLIYQCSKYPQEYEVQSFVTDFLESHKTIRCEADFKQFRIDNI